MDIEYILYRILSGYYFVYINENVYKIVNLDITIKQAAQNLYISILEKYKFDPQYWVSDLQRQHLLNINSIWGSRESKFLSDNEKILDKLKIDLYLKYSNEKQRKTVQKEIIDVNNTIRELLFRKNTFFDMTLESYAQSIKNEFLIMNMVYDSNNNKVFDQNIHNINLLQEIIQAISDKSISVTDLRKTARHDLWRSIWDSSKNNIFTNAGFLWTDEQRVIVNLSKMYDSVKEHPECPPDEIIDDDDALDGWMLYQKEKIEKEKKKNKIMNKLDNKYKNAGEIFMVTDSAEEAKEIYEMNDDMAKMQIREMTILASDDKSINWTELPFVQRAAKLKSQEMTAKKK